MGFYFGARRAGGPIHAINAQTRRNKIPKNGGTTGGTREESMKIG